MPSCVFRFCRNYTQTVRDRKDILLHCLPRKGLLREKWIKIIRTQRREYDWLPSFYTKICSIHFDPNDLYVTKNNLCKLKKTAVPVIEGKSKNAGESNIELSEEEDDVAGRDDDTLDDITEEHGADNSDELNIETNRKRSLISHTETGEKSTKKSRHIEIDYENIDKYGEQIAFLLKRLPRKLCRHLQGTIVSLIKTETKKYEKKTKKEAIPSTSKSSKLSRPVLSPTLGRYSKHKESEQLTIPEETVPIDTIPVEVKKESTIDETTQATQLLESQLGTHRDQRLISRTKIFPKPMTLPLELLGSIDCIKQEVFDPEEGSDITPQEQNKEATTSETTLYDPLNTKIKVEIEVTDLIEEPNRRRDSND